MQERRRKQTLRPRSDTTSPGLPRTSAYSIPRPPEARGRPNAEKRKAGAGGNPLQPKDPGPRPGSEEDLQLILNLPRGKRGSEAIEVAIAEFVDRYQKTDFVEAIEDLQAKPNLVSCPEIPVIEVR